MAEKRTYSERATTIKKAVTKRRKKIRLMAIEHLGGHCLVCGYDQCLQALEFHHRDPLKKDFGISETGCTRSWDRVKRELEQCILVCANCHREIHAGLTQLPTGTSE